MEKYISKHNMQQLKGEAVQLYKQFTDIQNQDGVRSVKKHTDEH